MGGGIVAEKKSVWRRAGRRWRTRRMSGRNPMSSMRSASSRTSTSRPGETGVGLPEVVEQAAGRGDEHVDAAAERLLLRPVADAAEDGGAGEARVAPELLAVLVDLRRQLARGGEDEDARGPARPPEQPVEDRQQERGRLAAAGHGAREHVAARENRRDGVPLDRGGRVEPEGGDAAQEVRVKLKRVERHGDGEFLQGIPGPGQSSAMFASRPTVRKRRRGCAV